MEGYGAGSRELDEHMDSILGFFKQSECEEGVEVLIEQVGQGEYEEECQLQAEARAQDIGTKVVMHNSEWALHHSEEGQMRA